MLYWGRTNRDRWHPEASAGPAAGIGSCMAALARRPGQWRGHIEPEARFGLLAYHWPLRSGGFMALGASGWRSVQVTKASFLALFLCLIGVHCWFGSQIEIQKIFGPNNEKLGPQIFLGSTWPAMHI